MKILITDYYCASNRGDAAIFEGMITSLKKYFPDSKITVLTNFPESAKIVHCVDAEKQMMTPFRFRNIRENMAIIYSLMGAPLIKRRIYLPGMKAIIKKKRLHVFINADFIVSSGGGFLNDFYAPGNLGRLYGLYFAKLLGKPVVLYAQSIGPFNRAPYRQIAGHILNRVDLITLRDHQSKEILESIGVSKPPVHVTADAAFSMPFSDSKPSQLRRKESTIPKSTGGLNISISVREWAHYSDAGGHKQYITALAALSDWLITEKDAKIVFASTCTGFAGYRYDDRVVAHEVIDHMNCSQSKNPVILYGEYTPRELSTFLGTMDLHIGTRMHSNILAMLAGTPVVAIQYEFKTAGLMNTFGLKNYLVNIERIQFGSLREKVEQALDCRHQLKKIIKSEIPRVKSKSHSTAKLVFEIIKEKLAVE